MRIPKLAVSLFIVIGACAPLSHRSPDPSHSAQGARASQLPDPTLPQPTEHRLRPGAEQANKRARKTWMAHMHRTAPGDDWKAIERRNGLNEMTRRRALQAADASSSYQTISTWTEVGSRNQAGRMHTALIGPARGRGRKLYAGSSLGGVWRGDIDGTGWEPLADNLYGGAHELLVVPALDINDPPVLVSLTDGGSASVSFDDGLTWDAAVGLENLGDVRGVGTLADQTMVVFGRYWSGSAWRSGLFASTDRGQSFSLRFSTGASRRGCIWVPRRGLEATDTIYLALQGRLRKSTDGGFTFPVLSTVLSSSTRDRLTGSEAGAPTLYMSVLDGSQWKLHRSDDGGQTFTFLRNLNDYWESICASSFDPSVVMYGGVEVWRSNDFGASFAKINGWGEYYGDPVNKLHADIPGLYCWPDPTGESDERWYICTDGGLYESLDKGLSVQNISLDGLGVSQYYSTLTSSRNPNWILAGAQDQGYQRGYLSSSPGPGPSTSFDQLISGDYGHYTSSDGTHDLVYCTYPGFILVQEGEDPANLLFPWLDFPAGSTHAWLPPVVADPLDPETVYFLADELWRYDRQVGSTWSHTRHSTYDFSSGTYLSALAFAPTDPQRVYAADDDGGMYYSTDHGVNWTQGSTSGPDAHYFYGSAIAVRPGNPLHAVVGGSGYSNPGVWRTIDGGQSWSSMANGLPQTLVYDLTFAGDGTGRMYAATEAGPYMFNPVSEAWSSISSTSSPITLYWSVESVSQGEIIRFGTYGRGIFDYRPVQSTNGRWIRHGEELGRPNVMLLTSTTPPNIGAEVELQVLGAGGATVGWVFTSLDAGSTPAFGGTILLGDIVKVYRVVLDPLGGGVRTARIPGDPLGAGTRIHYQAVVVDPNDPMSFLLSNSLEGIIGF